MNFWLNLPKPFTVLAPMANVTDWAFRKVIAHTGRPDVFYTEFVSADGICAIGLDRFKAELFFEPSERPIVAQIFGASPGRMAEAASLVAEFGFDGIDINMGCPDRSVDKQGAGAALIKNPKLAQEIIRAVKKSAGGLPVSVKTRLGYHQTEVDSWIPHLLDCNLAALTIHGRTKKDMSKVPARWDEIGRVAEMAKGTGTLVIGNGDVTDLVDARAKAKTYNLDGIMVGRGIFSNPWFFNASPLQNPGDPKARIELLMAHVENFERLHGQSKNFDVLKRFFKIYIQGWEGAKDLRMLLMATKNTDEARETIASVNI